MEKKELTEKDNRPVALVSFPTLDQEQVLDLMEALNKHLKTANVTLPFRMLAFGGTLKVVSIEELVMFLEESLKKIKDATAAAELRMASAKNKNHT